MPGKHKKGNRRVDAWLTPEQLARFEELVRETGLSESELIRKALFELADRKGIKKNEDNRENQD